MYKTIIRTLVSIIHKLHVVWWFFTRPKTQGVKGVLLHKDKVLLVKLAYAHRQWSIPGGRVDKKETAQMAVVREIQEELGIQTSIDEWRYIGSYRQNIEYKDDTVTCFMSHLAGTEYTIDAVEIEKAEWYDVTNLPTERTASVDKIIHFLAVAS